MIERTQVVSGSGPIGSIVRKYPGFMKQAFTNCDNFALNCACGVVGNGRIASHNEKKLRFTKI